MKSNELFPIWHLANKSFKPTRLFDTADGNFLVIEEGEWAPIISSGSFILVDRELSYFLQSPLDEPLKRTGAVIYDRTLNKYFHGYHYHRIYVKNKVNLETIKRVDHSGKKIWYEQYGGVFVSISLKQAIEQAGIKDLEFHAGFSRFAGGK